MPHWPSSRRSRDVRRAACARSKRYDKRRRGNPGAMDRGRGHDEACSGSARRQWRPVAARKSRSSSRQSPSPWRRHAANWRVSAPSKSRSDRRRTLACAITCRVKICSKPTSLPDCSYRGEVGDEIDRRGSRPSGCDGMHELTAKCDASQLEPPFPMENMRPPRR